MQRIAATLTSAIWLGCQIWDRGDESREARVGWVDAPHQIFTNLQRGCNGLQNECSRFDFRKRSHLRPLLGESSETAQAVYSLSSALSPRCFDGKAACMGRVLQRNWRVLRARPFRFNLDGRAGANRNGPARVLPLGQYFRCR